MSLDVRKHVFVGLRTSKAKASLCIRYSIFNILSNDQIKDIYGYSIIFVFYENSSILKDVKPVFGVYKARLEPVSSVKETIYKIGISLVASLDMILSNERITKVLICARMRRLVCDFVVRKTPKDRFSCVKAQIDSSN